MRYPSICSTQLIATAALTLCATACLAQTVPQRRSDQPSSPSYPGTLTTPTRPSATPAVNQRDPNMAGGSGAGFSSERSERPVAGNPKVLQDTQKDARAIESATRRSCPGCPAQ